MEVQEQFGDDITIVGVPGLASAGEFPGFIEATGTGGITHVSDETGEVWSRFGVTQQRTYVYINDDGTSRIAGYGNLAGAVADLIAQ